MEKLQPPQDITLEQVLLGLCLESQDNYEIMMRVIAGDPAAIMYSRRNAELMQAMTNLVMQKQSFDVSTIRIELTRMGRWDADSGIDELAALYNAASSNRGNSVDSVASYLGDLHRKRMLIEACTKGLQGAYDPTQSSIDVIGKHQSDLAKIDTHVAKFEFTTYGEQIDPFLARMQQKQEEIAKGDRDIVGQPTGSTLVDYNTGGDKAGELIIVAARPGEGKSTYVLQAAKAGALRGDAQGILSLEMDNDMQLGRALADFANIPNNRMQQAKLTVEDWAAINGVRDDFARLPIYLDFCPGLDIVILEAKIRYLVRVKGIKRVFIDYLQLMDSPKTKGEKRDFANFNMKISEITKRLKQLAGELGIAIVLLSQMSRDVEKRTGEKMPMLSDLRDSGSIEQDANTVIFLYSPFSYEESNAGYCFKWYPQMGIEDMRRLTFLIVAKQRNGKVFKCPIWNDRKYCRMSDIREMGIYSRLGVMGLFDEDEALMAKLGIIALSNQIQLFPTQNENQNASTIDSPVGDFFPF